MSGSGKRSRQRQLAKTARQRQQMRAAQQRHRRVQQGIAATIAGLLVIALGGVLLFRPESKSTAKPSRRPSVSPTSSPSAQPVTKDGTVNLEGTPPTTVACGASLPPDAGKPKPQFSGPPKQTLKQGDTYTAIVSTSCGIVEIKLDAVDTPLATNNFVFLADRHFYDGIWFHRIVKGFMIQGGDPVGTGGGGPGYKFTTEVNQSIKFGDKAGVLAYANSGPDTNGSQFFITVAPQSFLDTSGPYTAFGQVVKGLDVLKTISNLPSTTDAACQPQEACRTKDAVYINSITIKVTKPKPSSSPSP
ncbi:MAG: peptidylprolyl isomerase [Actinomycetota bacterium]